MADVSKFKVPIKSGSSTSLTEYDIKDSTARSGLADKVDKVTGKGLSTNDYTTTEKEKLAGIASGAEVNVQSDWSQTTNTADDFIKNKPTLGTAAAKDVASTGNASTTQVVMGNDTRLTDARTPTSHTHTKSQITDFPTLGTAAAKNVAASGNASSTQVVMGNDTRLSDSRPASDVSAWAKASTKPSYTATEVGAIATTSKGANNGVAELDSNGKVPSAQLPSFVDDVIEGYYYNSKFYKESTHTTEITGESGKIYVDLSTDKTYRWGGSSYVVISETLALGETSTTAYRGDRGKTAYDHSQTTHARTDATAVTSSTTNGNIKINGTETTVYTHPGSGTNPHGTTKTDVGLGNVGNFKAVSTVASQGLTDTEKSNARANIGAGTSNLTIGTTSTTAAAGDHTHSTSIATSTGTNQATLAANTKYAITAGGTSYVFTTPPDTNTWRPVQDNLTSDSTTDSLSAAQGKALKSLVDGKAASGHTHSTSIATSTGTSQITLAASSKYAISAGGTSYIFTTPPNTTYSNATQSTAGLMSSTDKTKLDGVATGATANTGTVTSVATGAGLTGGTITGSGTVKANLVSETVSTLEATTMGSTANRQYAVGLDKNNKLSVNVPWTDHNTTYAAGTGTTISGTNNAINVSYGTTAGTACQGNDSRLSDARTPTSHTHGNIQNAGTLQTNDITIASGDKLVVTDSSDSNKVARASVSFDGSTATKCLTQKGTWESFSNNAGTVTSVKVGTTSYSPSSGVVSLPAYPTSLPASNTTSTYSSTGTVPVNGTAVAAALATLPSPMVFKGSLGTGGTITALPVNGTATVGDTYKVITAGTYASQAAKVGDIFICDSKTSSANTWTYIPSADEPSGTVTNVAISNGGAIAVSGSPITTSGTITISHADTSSQASVNNSGRTYIQDITLDDYGHVTGIASATETVTNTDTKVTSADNHYSPSTVSGQDKTASASGATAAWSIDVVKGVTLNTDGKGHVTGVSVTSGKIPANPNTDVSVKQSLSTTNKNYPLLLSYAESSDTTANVTNLSYRSNSLYANPSTGNIQATQLNGVTIGSSPKFTDTTYAAGTGTTISGTNNAINVSYGTTANTACQGNDSRLSDARTPTSHTHGNIQNGGTLQTTDITIANGDKLVVTDSSDSSKVARTSIAFDGSTTTKALTQKGTWETFGTSNLTIGTTSTTAAAGNHTHSTSIATSAGTNQITLAASTKYAITAGETSYVFTTPPDSGANSVKYTSQTLTGAQKTQAQTNIGIVCLSQSSYDALVTKDANTIYLTYEDEEVT